MRILITELTCIYIYIYVYLYIYIHIFIFVLTGEDSEMGARQLHVAYLLSAQAMDAKYDVPGAGNFS